MSELTYETFPSLLRNGVPGFARVYDEHVADNDGVLPHVLMGDLVRFLCEQIESNGAEQAPLRDAMVLLERAASSTDPRITELVTVSFLENLDPDDPATSVIKGSFGPKLQMQYLEHEAALRN